MTRPTIEIVDDEGSVVTVRGATLGERLSAVLVDHVILLGLFFLLVYLAIFAARSGGFGELSRAAFSVLILFFHFFWFALFEVGRRGATPGKRLLGLRVLDRSGRALTAEAAFVRNAVRWLEVIPCFAIALNLFGPWESTTFSEWMFWSWMLGLGLVPFVHREGRRLGDLAADTIVVRLRRAFLSVDLATASPRPAADSGTTPESFVFTEAALDVYGEHELRTLEALIRTASQKGARQRAARASVLIAAKIGRTPPSAADVDAFLRAFYGALRSRLERRLALGRRKRDQADED